MNHQLTTTISIAGHDASGGAGILADVKTFEQCGVHGFGVVSALTFQNDVEFEGVDWIAPEKIIRQTELLLRRFKVQYVKIGLIEDLDVLQEIVGYLQQHIEQVRIIFDPVLKASAGYAFHGADFAARLQNIMPALYCITPNIPEAKTLFGENMLHQTLQNQPSNIYLKGGHTEEDIINDYLFTHDNEYRFFNKKIPNGEKHGSGCVLSAALTAYLALGMDIVTASRMANQYTQRFLASNPSLLGHHQISYEL
ncbi:hydroxymethylpyrimidine/phosphomethylpyrimidine kinase [Taibaiella soli]|uniref:hydroxymethylpyrimidine kinase n=1 Tax=Taibaiella soli TaxID=1649169 RepID=A0A2W2A7Y4_9BACT|nr:hydroxymethylpyrimidine/phosphomethylpyrimidine kinase [Taibaiella soli]PZF71465.1 hydroxymethylpyrimidine/phosphomethylpyrimidine kinase [Taibaiella soli]